MEGMHKVRAGIMRVLGIVITCLFALMTVIGTYQIVTRYFFNRPSTVSEELLTYSFTWMSLLASAYVFGKRDHMRMGFLADKFTGPGRRYLEAAIDLLTFAFAGVVMVYGGISITKLTMIESALHALVTPVNKVGHGLTRWKPDEARSRRWLIRRYFRGIAGCLSGTGRTPSLYKNDIISAAGNCEQTMKIAKIVFTCSPLFVEMTGYQLTSRASSTTGL